MSETPTATTPTRDAEAGIVFRGAPDVPPDVSSAGYRISWLFSGQKSPGAEQTLGYVVIEPGQKNPLHAHDNCEELLYLLTGELDHSLGDAMHHLRPGDAIRVPAGIRHDARCTSTEPARMIVCYSSPQRAMTSYE